MTDEELKKKIEDILEEYNFETDDGEGWVLSTDEMADALIAAGIGDVKEAEAEANRYEMLYKLQNQDMALAERRAHDAEHRAEVAEKALDKATELAYEYRTEADTLSCSSCPMFHIFDRCKECGLYKDCSKRWREELLQQAEKELAEGGEDD